MFDFKNLHERLSKKLVKKKVVKKSVKDSPSLSDEVYYPLFVPTGSPIPQKMTKKVIKVDGETFFWKATSSTIFIFNLENKVYFKVDKKDGQEESLTEEMMSRQKWVEQLHKKLADKDLRETFEIIPINFKHLLSYPQNLFTPDGYKLNKETLHFKNGSAQFGNTMTIIKNTPSELDGLGFYVNRPFMESSKFISRNKETNKYFSEKGKPLTLSNDKLQTHFAIWDDYPLVATVDVSHIDFNAIGKIITGDNPRDRFNYVWVKKDYIFAANAFLVVWMNIKTTLPKDTSSISVPPFGSVKFKEVQILEGNKTLVETDEIKMMVNNSTMEKQITDHIHLAETATDYTEVKSSSKPLTPKELKEYIKLPLTSLKKISEYNLTKVSQNLNTYLFSGSINGVEIHLLSVKD